MRIVHLADLHIGYRAYNRLDKKGINIREKDVLKAFNESLEKISKINPDLIVIAGDIFHRPRPTNTSIYNTILLLQKFRQQSPDIPIIMVSGNHEAVKSFESGSILKIFETVIPKVKVVDGKIEEIPIDYLDTSILCIPYNDLSNIENTILKPNKDYKYNIAVVHGTSERVKELVEHSKGAVIKDTNLDCNEWDYIAFGHYHKFTKLAPNSYYSGAIELTTSNIWEESKDKKGFIEYDLDNKTCHFHHLLNVRQVVDVKRLNAIDLTGNEITQKITEEISKIRDFENSIVRMSIENIDPVAFREIDYKTIRELKKIAIHFRTNFLKKSSANNLENTYDQKSSKGIFDCLNEEIQQFELSNGINREKFSKLAKEYLEMELTKCD